MIFDNARDITKFFIFFYWFFHFFMALWQLIFIFSGIYSFAKITYSKAIVS